jgi:hypothetical protein
VRERKKLSGERKNKFSTKNNKKKLLRVINIGITPKFESNKSSSAYY